MKAQKLIPSIAAVLFTFASLNVVNYNVPVQPATGSKAGTMKVIELAPINVRPSAAELRAAALLADVGTGIATVPSMSRIYGSSTAESFSLLGAPLAMPYYSFGNKFGRITKE